MSRAGFEPTIPVFQPSKDVQNISRAATVIFLLKWIFKIERSCTNMTGFSRPCICNLYLSVPCACLGNCIQYLSLYPGSVYSRYQVPAFNWTCTVHLNLICKTTVTQSFLLCNLYRSSPDTQTMLRSLKDITSAFTERCCRVVSTHASYQISARRPADCGFSWFPSVPRGKWQNVTLTIEDRAAV